MAGQLSARSEFSEILAIHMAIKAALRARQYDRLPAVRGLAEKLCRDLEGERSTFGRQLKMIAMMEKGATVEDLRRKLRSSRRTVFRYLNNLESAGLNITLVDGKYQVDRTLARLVRG